MTIGIKLQTWRGTAFTRHITPHLCPGASSQGTKTKDRSTVDESTRLSTLARTRQLTMKAVDDIVPMHKDFISSVVDGRVIGTVPSIDGGWINILNRNLHMEK